MKHFLLGVAVGAVAMGYHTGYIRVFLGDDQEAAPKPDAASAT